MATLQEQRQQIISKLPPEKQAQAQQLVAAYEAARGPNASSHTLDSALRSGNLSAPGPGQSGAGQPSNYTLSPDYWNWVANKPTDVSGTALADWQRSNPFYVDPKQHETFDGYLNAVTTSTASENIPALADPHRYQSALLSYYGAGLGAVQLDRSPQELALMMEENPELVQMYQRARDYASSAAGLEAAGLLPGNSYTAKAQQHGVPVNSGIAGSVDNYRKIALHLGLDPDQALQMKTLQSAYDQIGSEPFGGGTTIPQGGSAAPGAPMPVYGPDGTEYPSPQAAIAAGVINYSTTPPRSGTSMFMMGRNQAGNSNPGGLIGGANQQLFQYGPPLVKFPNPL